MSRPHQSRKTAALKGQLTDWNRDRSQASVPSQHPAGRPVRPSTLDKEGRREWNKQVRALYNERGTLTKADASILALHCALHSRLQACQREMDEHGMFETDADGFRIETAASKLATKLSAQIRQTLIQLGATPSSREKTKRATEPEPEDVPVDPLNFLISNPGKCLPEEVK